LRSAKPILAVALAVLTACGTRAGSNLGGIELHVRYSIAKAQGGCIRIRAVPDGADAGSVDVKLTGRPRDGGVEVAIAPLRDWSREVTLPGTLHHADDCSGPAVVMQTLNEEFPLFPDVKVVEMTLIEGAAGGTAGGGAGGQAGGGATAGGGASAGGGATAGGATAGGATAGGATAGGATAGGATAGGATAGGATAGGATAGGATAGGATAGGATAGGATAGGAVLPNGSACTIGPQCSSTFCVDGYCCASACGGLCQACSNNRTGAGNGTCAPVTVNTDPDSECTTQCNGAGACEAPNGTACTAASQCQSGFCVDGFCCNVACTGTCQACSAAKSTGANGACSPVDMNTDPDTECAGSTTCNGAGACWGPVGNSCNNAGQCQGGFCVDGFCCSGACTTLCQACSNAKTGSANGTCADVTPGTDPDNDCAGATTCAAAGTCTLPLGASCSTGPQCQSGFCVDGVCCNSLCGAKCEACTAAKKGAGGGGDGTCGFIAAGTDPDTECPGANDCTGAGACTND